ncbi:eukaryotic translation initiation factor 4 gamma 1-like isoform X3 [Lineus longissimus]|uniref:eukaryotic translation initiation factor 4 gamma 1-like isoform X3 n=1 Tax=Lineus longissimus TaxID=88925 RepID=UPI00315DDDAD
MSVQKGTHHSVSPSAPVHPQQQGTRPQQPYYPQGHTPPIQQQYRQEEYQQVRQPNQPYYAQSQKQFPAVPRGGNPHDMSKQPMSTTVPNPGQGPSQQMMYHQPNPRTPPFYPPTRPTQPQGIPQQTQRHVRMSAGQGGQPPTMYPYPQTNLVISQTGGYIGQPQATMMMQGSLPMQASPGQYMGEDMMTMSGGATIIYQTGPRPNMPQQYINTSQPNQLNMQPPVGQTYQTQGPVTYYSPQGQPQYHMGAQPNRPPSASSNYAPPARERKVIRITDPNSGQDVTDDLLGSAKSAKTGTPPLSSGPSSARATPVVAQQAEDEESSELSQAEESAPPQSPSPLAQSNIAAQFASQVAATLNSDTLRPVQPQPTVTKPESEQLGEETPQVETDVNSELDSKSNQEKQDVNSIPEPAPSVVVPAAVETPETVAEEAVKTDTSHSDKDVHVERTPKISEPSEVVSESKIDEKPAAVVEKTPEPVEPVEKVPVVTEEETASAEAKSKSKRHKKDLNEKGKTKEGTDMDLFVEEAATAKPVPVVVPEPTPAPVTEVNNVDQKLKDKPALTVEINVEESNEAKVQEKNEKNDVKSHDVPETNSKIGMPKKDKSTDYDYKEETFSPLSPEAKMHYDRDFLLSLQFTTGSKSKPDGLPKLPDVILDRPRQMGDTGGRSPLIKPGSQPDFTPGFIKSSIPGRMSGGSGGGGSGRDDRGRMGGSGRRGSEQGRKEPKKIILELPLAHQIELHHAENAWKPSTKTADVALTPEEQAEQEVYKAVRAILNKLTPQKFQVLMNQILELQIDTEEKLKGVIDLIFEKAIDEPNFSVPYAHMCKHMMIVKVPAKSPSSGKLGDTVLFRKFLLTRCQKEFEKDKANELDLATRQKAIDEADSEDRKKVLTLELNYEAAKSKRRSLGNIRFIGELFKLKMLTEHIMHDCLVKLLRSNDEDNLECLCRLLTTIGKDIDHDKAKPRIDQYFQQMDKIVKQKRTSARVRFMIQDVIELRSSNWVPRRDDNKPKTIDQIHQEVQRERQEEQFLIAQHALNPQPVSAKKRGPPGGGRGQAAPNFGPAQNQSEDGWKTVSAKNTIDPTKMKLSKPSVDENSIQLGPGGRPGFSWGRGSSGGSKMQQNQSSGGDSSEPRPSTPSNRFSALSQADGGYDSRGRGAGRGLGPRPDSRSRQQQGTPGRHDRGKNTRMSQELEREQAIAAVRVMKDGRSLAQSRQGSTGRQGGSREGSRSRENRDDIEPIEGQREPERQKPAVVQLSDENMEKKAKAIIDEYLHLQDIKEAMLCISELEEQKNIHVFVTATINHVLERSEKARQQAGHLLHDVVKGGLITVADYLKGLNEVLEYAEDMEIDIPKIWAYFGELIGPMVHDGSVPMVFLKDACKPLHGRKAGVLVAAILHDASHRLGHIKVGELWRQSKLQWTDFLAPSDDLEKFLQDNKLEFTVASREQHVTRSLSIENIMDQLQELLSKKSADNEEVFDWIEANVGEAKAKEAKFIRALMTEVCASAIEGSGATSKLDDTLLKKRSVVLQKYLDHQADLELQALYALQALVNSLEHPPGLMQMFFDTLYDEDIISEDAFYTWETSTDPAEQEGKGVAKKSVVQFFTWLKEAEETGGDDS